MLRAPGPRTTSARAERRRLRGCRRHGATSPARTVWFGAGEGVAIRDDEAAIRLRLGGGEERYPLARVALVGAHNRENMMAAIAAARAFGVPPRACSEALEAFRGLDAPARARSRAERRALV